LGGQYIKPVALANLFSFHEKLKDHMPLVGVGGISTGWDAFEHVLCGASLVQIGSALQREGLSVFERLNRELTDILHHKKYRSLEECRGKLQFEHEAWKHGYTFSEP
jgi:dihydroorotate dehydrogenase (fumarate)